MKSFKTRLILNDKERTKAKKHAGVNRHAYNWAVAYTEDCLKNNLPMPSAISLHKILVAEVKKDNPWYYESSKYTPQQALRNLESAWKRCFKKIAKKPKFKKKGTNESFYLEGNIQIKENKIKLPKFGWVRTHEILPDILKGKSGIANVTISLNAGEWYISFKVNSEEIDTPKIRNIIGVDVGINKLATLSNGTVFENPKAYRKNKKKLAKAQRNLARKQKNSKNREKAKIKVQKVHYRISCIRKDALHKITTHLSKNHRLIMIEDLNVNGMLKNHKLASAISDCGWREFRNQLEYKTKLYGSELCLVDRFYPSSKICSSCGFKKDKLSLSARTYICDSCGITIDRDLNASLNIEKYIPEALGVKSVEDKENLIIRNQISSETEIKQHYLTKVK